MIFMLLLDTLLFGAGFYLERSNPLPAAVLFLLSILTTWWTISLVFRRAGDRWHDSIEPYRRHDR